MEPLSEIAGRKKALEDEVLSELCVAASKIVPAKRNVSIPHIVYFDREYWGDDDEDERQLIHRIKADYLHFLLQKGVLENCTEREIDVERDFGPPETVFSAIIELYPEKVLAYSAKEKFQGIPVVFDDETGELRVGDKKTTLARGSKQYTLIKLLYAEPNRIHDYGKIAVALGVEISEGDDYALRALVSQGSSGRSGRRRANSKLVRTVKNINDLVYQIKEKLGMEKSDESFLICNGGYMLRL